MNKHLTSIVLPYYNHWDLTYARLGDIYKHAPLDRIEVILVNDASPDPECRLGVGHWQKLNLYPTKYIENKENLGFGDSHNKGAKGADGDILIFLSNDVVITGKFVEQVEQIIDDHNGEVFIGNEVLYFDTGWNVIEINGKPSIVCYPVGYFLACTKTMWERIGGFDPIYGKYDYEDVDLGAWCIYNDVPMVALNNRNLRHLGEQTVRKVNPNREEHTKKNGILFREKWTEKLKEKYG